MGRKDISEKRLLELPDVAADAINAALHEGKNIVQAKELELMNGQEYSADEQGNFHDRRRDVLYRHVEKDIVYALYGIENETEIDYTMPLRVAEYDCSVYRRQIDRFRKENKERGVELLGKVLFPEQRLVPVVTIVLFYGKCWSGPRSIQEMIEFAGREVLKPYVMDMRLNVLELGAEKNYKKFKSDIRLIAEYLSLQGDRKALNDYARRADLEIAHPEEFLNVMAEITSDARYKIIRSKVAKQQRKGEKIKMCTIIDDYMEMGIEQGKKQGIEQGIKQVVGNMIKRGMSVEDICAIAECSEEFVEEVQRL